MMRSGLKVPTPEIPIPDFAVPYAAPIAVLSLVLPYASIPIRWYILTPKGHRECYSGLSKLSALSVFDYINPSSGGGLNIPFLRTERTWVRIPNLPLWMQTETRGVFGTAAVARWRQMRWRPESMGCVPRAS